MQHTRYTTLALSVGRTYALKKVSMKDQSKKERQEAVNEIRLLASIAHSNIIKYSDSFIEKNDLYIVTEVRNAIQTSAHNYAICSLTHALFVWQFAPRGDLGGKIGRHKNRKERMPEKVIWMYFVQICQALEYMHSRQILHRDLKPMKYVSLVFRFSSLSPLSIR